MRRRKITVEMKYKNPALSPEERADDLLRRLNIDEKMAQVNCIFPFGEGYEDYEKLEQEMPFGIGQVSTLEMRRIETLEEAQSGRETYKNSNEEQFPWDSCNLPYGGIVRGIYTGGSKFSVRYCERKQF